MRIDAHPNSISNGDSGLEIDVFVLSDSRNGLEHYNDVLGRIGTIDGAGYAPPGKYGNPARYFNGDHAHRYNQNNGPYIEMNDPNPSYIPLLREVVNQSKNSGKLKVAQ